MTNEEMMKQVIEDDNKEFKKYAEDKLRRVDILREMGYTADQAIKLMTYFCLEEIVNVLVSPEAETVAEVPLTTYAPGYTFFRIGGSVDTDTL